MLIIELCSRSTKRLLTGNGGQRDLGILGSTADQGDLDGTLNLTGLPLDAEGLASSDLLVLGRAGDGVEAINLGHGRDGEGGNGGGDSSETHLDGLV